MHLSQLSTASDDRASALSEIRIHLGLLAGGLERRFAEAGNGLAAAYDIIERLVASLEGVTNAMDAEASNAAVQNMRTTADHLAQLPALQTLRQRDLGTIQRASAKIRGEIAQINRILRFLHICSHNIKIAAAGAEEFLGFADDMAARLDQGEQLLEGCEAEISVIAQRSSEVMGAEKMLAAECVRIIPQVPAKLAKDATALQQHQAALTALAGQIAELARDIRARVAAALGALQIGDITRQRLEHCVAGMELLTVQDPIDGETHQIMVARVTALLAAQVTDAVSDFRREASLLGASLDAIGPAALRLLALRNGDGGQEDSSHVFFSELEHGIAAVQSVTERLRDADEHSGLLSQATSQAVEKLALQLRSIEKVKSDVQQMAWNTGVRCARMNHQSGRGLAVISSEISGFATHLEAVTGHIGESFGGLSSAARSIQERQAASGKDAGQALAESFALIQTGSERLKESLSGLGSDASSVAQILTTATESVGDHGGGADEALEDTAARLAALVPAEQALPDAAVEPLRDMFNRILRSYTMASEREVHARFALPGDDIPVETGATPAADISDDDLFDDAFF